MNNIGSTIKKIRVSKGLTQQYLANKSNMTQSNYSKFEKNLLEIRVSSFLLILDTLNIPLQEFDYISNNYKLSYKEDIIVNFFNTPYQNTSALKTTIKSCIEYLKTNESKIIEDLILICEALLIISDRNDFKEARLIAQPVWDRVSISNQFNLYDLYLINSILYIFTIEEILLVRSYLIKSFNKYKNYPYINSILINTYINISLLLIENKRYTEALEDLTFVYAICKKQKLFLNLSIINIRIGICHINLNNNGNDYIQKGLLWLKEFDENEIFEIMQNEVKIYTNLHI